MKTTFLLHGGRLKIKDTRNDEYFRALTKDLEDGDIILHVPFARRTEKEQAETFKREKGLLLAQTDKKVQVEMATKENFEEQLRRAKAVHITGGQSPELVDDIKQYPNFIDLLKGKTVGGSSAGACLFSTYYWYGEQGEVLHGLGTLPIALFVHYGNPEFLATDKELELLKPYAEDLELLTLEETEWVRYER